jgi:hypothetical protein
MCTYQHRYYEITMKIHNIIDFRDTGIYKHKKLVAPSDLTDEQLIVRTCKDTYNNLFYTLRDSHVLSDMILTEDSVRINVPLGSSKNMYDGIYDIWLKDCSNVKSISIVFDNVEIPITEFKVQGHSVQIPLAFVQESTNEGVKHLFTHNEYSFGSKTRLSYIPAVAIAYDNMYITINSGASCKVHISTVYLENDYRRRIAQSSNTFYVNGIPLVARCGTVCKVPDESVSNKGCVLC